VAWQPVTNRAVLAGVTNQTVGNILTPPRGQQFWYDTDGNLLSDGVWTNTWDAENRLVRVVSRADTPSTSWQSIVFAYDPQGRRTSKVASNWTGSAWSKVTDQRFVYDGWNLVAILDSQSSLLQSFTWGLDLSGSMQGAGGVGGLLAVLTPTNGNHFCAFDGNGNLAAFVSATNATETARYEYGPFGEVIRVTGPMAKANPMRFSTKFQDDETGMLYYGYRYYRGTTGSWISRDPIAETGGINVYAFALNAPVRRVEPRGLYSTSPGSTPSEPACAAPYCKCKRVTITNSQKVVGPVQRPPPPTEANGTPWPPGTTAAMNLGIAFPYTIEVEGDPSLCKCKYIDSGTVTVSINGGEPIPRTFDPTSDKDVHPIEDCKVKSPDFPGVEIGLDVNDKQISYDITYAFTATVVCDGTDGSHKQESASSSDHMTGTIPVPPVKK
jgi:RHS repeat-associated protein